MSAQIDSLEGYFIQEIFFIDSFSYDGSWEYTAVPERVLFFAPDECFVDSVIEKQSFRRMGIYLEMAGIVKACYEISDRRILKEGLAFHKNLNYDKPAIFFSTDGYRKYHNTLFKYLSGKRCYRVYHGKIFTYKLENLKKGKEYAFCSDYFSERQNFFLIYPERSHLDYLFFFVR